MMVSMRAPFAPARPDQPGQKTGRTSTVAPSDTVCVGLSSMPTTPPPALHTARRPVPADHPPQRGIADDPARRAWRAATTGAAAGAGAVAPELPGAPPRSPVAITVPAPAGYSVAPPPVSRGRGWLNRRLLIMLAVVAALVVAAVIGAAISAHSSRLTMVSSQSTDGTFNAGDCVSLSATRVTKSDCGGAHDAQIIQVIHGKQTCPGRHPGVRRQRRHRQPLPGPRQQLQGLSAEPGLCLGHAQPLHRCTDRTGATCRPAHGPGGGGRRPLHGPDAVPARRSLPAQRVGDAGDAAAHRPVHPVVGGSSPCSCWCAAACGAPCARCCSWRWRRQRRGRRRRDVRSVARG